MKILLVGNFARNNGSSQATFNYSRVAGVHGHEVKVSEKYGRLDPYVRRRFDLCRDNDWADRWIFIIESYPYMNDQEIKEVQETIPRDRIWIVDSDGHYGPTVTSGNDTNHASPYTSEFWHDHYAALSDQILQPRLSTMPIGAQFFPFYGMSSLPTRLSRSPRKPYSILYVGNNWYRWEAVRAFLMDLKPIRSRLGRIALRGKWWNGEVLKGLEQHTHVDKELLRELKIKVEPAISFDSVVREMGKTLITPIFVRQMIAAQQLITPRMFEALSAETIPIFGHAGGYIQELYGSESHMLCFDQGIAELILQILENPMRYFELTQSIRERVYQKYNYHALLEQLVSTIA